MNRHDFLCVNTNYRRDLRWVLALSEMREHTDCTASEAFQRRAAAISQMYAIEREYDGTP